MTAFPTLELPKSYEPKAIEEAVYRFWEQARLFAAKDESDRPSYCIVLPPPNITGALHMGHALTATVQDMLVRWRRMHGDNALWLPGTDHAGIATQMVVERALRAEGKTRHDLGREKFLEKVWEWKDKYGSRITEQHKRLGASLDWERERFTMDEGSSRAVREAFVRLYEQGKIGRDNRLINWCVSCRTALSDVEVDRDKPEMSELWSFAYEIDGGGEIVVATTRPETMLGDTAVVVHPDDERYKHLIGKKVRHPFQDRLIPIVADELLADPTLGTGAVKVTPAHDPNDFECGKRHGLDFIDMLTDDGIVNDKGAPFAGLDRFEARARVKDAITQKGLFRGRKDHEYAPGRCQRCRSVVEPKLSLQWFVDTTEMAQRALDAARCGRTQFVPPQQSHRYFDWLEKKLPWCISRQLWWGHRIPAWYCDQCGATLVSREHLATCTSCGSPKLRQDEDVLDTWFSSALWPFSTLGWPDDTAALRTFYPTSVLETGPDIVTFWVSRMMMMGLALMNEVPFDKVLLHPIVRDQDGNKMSKSRGNVIDPMDVIEGIGIDALIEKTKGYTLPQKDIDDAIAYQKEHFPQGFPECGTDALRFTLAAYTGQDQDIRFSVERVEGYRKFGNKIWQATLGFALPHVQDLSVPPGVPQPVTLADKWLLSRLGEVAREVNLGFAEFRVGEATQVLYKFFWDELCSWYIELIKPVLSGEDEGEKQAARQVLRYGLDVSLRLLHPLMPFLTEVLWQKLPQAPGAPPSIMIAPYPTEADGRYDAASTSDALRMMEVITAVRTMRAEYDLPPSAKVHVCLHTDEAQLRDVVEANARLVHRLCRLESLDIVATSQARPKGSATAVVKGGEICLPLKGLVDIVAERARLEKELGKLGKYIDSAQKKLSNPGFLSKAPPSVVESEQSKVASAKDQSAKIEEALVRLKDLEDA
ncbi:MAG: valine--tRNA ligase [Myxococcota bacterium]|jgi:valyl-tRNA synthetase|nr:valine--tRNA ligase [Myxococcota bacterium]